MNTDYKKIKTFADAAKALGIDPKKLPDVKGLKTKYRKFVVACYKLSIIAEALNGKWKADWDNDDQAKYWPYFKATKTKKGAAFSYDDYFHYSAWDAHVGSRLVYANSELAEYAGKTFIKEYTDYLGNQ